jgi:hypothetical protein
MKHAVRYIAVAMVLVVTGSSSAIAAGQKICSPVKRPTNGVQWCRFRVNGPWVTAVLSQLPSPAPTINWGASSPIP